MAGGVAPDGWTRRADRRYDRKRKGLAQLYVLIIKEKSDSWAGRSPFGTEHATRQAAEAELLDYVRRNWDAEMGTDPPEDPEEMIQEYFSEVLEAYEIREVRTA